MWSIQLLLRLIIDILWFGSHNVQYSDIEAPKPLVQPHAHKVICELRMGCSGICPVRSWEPVRMEKLTRMTPGPWRTSAKVLLWVKKKKNYLFNWNAIRLNLCWLSFILLLSSAMKRLAVSSITSLWALTYPKLSLLQFEQDQLSVLTYSQVFQPQITSVALYWTYSR